MFNPWKARRQKLTARWAMWNADGHRALANVRSANAGAKLKWNQKERRLRKWMHGLGDRRDRRQRSRSD